MIKRSGYTVETINGINSSYIGSERFDQEMNLGEFLKTIRFLQSDNFKLQGVNDEKIRRVVQMRQVITKQTRDILQKGMFVVENKRYQVEECSRLGRGVLSYSAANVRLYTKKSYRKFEMTKFKGTKVIVTNHDFLDVARNENKIYLRDCTTEGDGRKYRGRVSIVLGCHPNSPGGSYLTNGKEYDDGIEEECYRRTSLYNSIMDPLKVTKISRNWPYVIPSFGGIFVPQVLAMRQNEDVGYDFYDGPFQDINMILVAALKKPKVADLFDDNRYKDYPGYSKAGFDRIMLNKKFRGKFEEKFRSIFSIAKMEKEEVLIFAGPFGCFKSPPFDIAYCARCVIEKEFPNAFRRIIFCCKENRLAKYNENTIYEPFKYCFEKTKKLSNIPDHLGEIDPNLVQDWNSPVTDVGRKWTKEQNENWKKTGANWWGGSWGSKPKYDYLNTPNNFMKFFNPQLRESDDDKDSLGRKKQLEVLKSSNKEIDEDEYLFVENDNIDQKSENFMGKEVFSPSKRKDISKSGKEKRGGKKVNDKQNRKHHERKSSDQLLHYQGKRRNQSASHRANDHYFQLLKEDTVTGTTMDKNTIQLRISFREACDLIDGLKAECRKLRLKRDFQIRQLIEMRDPARNFQKIYNRTERRSKLDPFRKFLRSRNKIERIHQRRKREEYDRKMIKKKEKEEKELSNPETIVNAKQPSISTSRKKINQQRKQKKNIVNSKAKRIDNNGTLKE